MRDGLPGWLGAMRMAPKRMTDSQHKPAATRATDHFKRFFCGGLAALLPTVLTFALLMWAYDLIDRQMGRYLSHGMVSLLAAGGPPQLLPAEKVLDDALEHGEPIDEWDAQEHRLTVEYQIATDPILGKPGAGQAARKAAEPAGNVALWNIAFVRYKLYLIGFPIAIVLVYFVGLFLASLIGRTAWRIIERALHRIPVVKAVYENIGQVTDFALRDRPLQFAGVVAEQYSREGWWSLGPVMGPARRSLREAAGEELLTVFVPSSPTPVTGSGHRVAEGRNGVGAVSG